MQKLPHNQVRELPFKGLRESYTSTTLEHPSDWKRSVHFSWHLPSYSKSYVCNWENHLSIFHLIGGGWDKIDCMELIKEEASALMYSNFRFVSFCSSGRLLMERGAFNLSAELEREDENRAAISCQHARFSVKQTKIPTRCLLWSSW